MALSIEDFENIISDDSLLFTEEELKRHPTQEQINNYKKFHPYYNGKHLEIWTLYFEIIEHLAGHKFSGTSEEESIMKLSMNSKNWNANESHDVKYVSLLFTTLSNKMTGKMLSHSFEKEWEMLMNYTSMCLPNQIKYMLADLQKSKLFGRYNIRNLPEENKNAMRIMIQTKRI